MILVELCRWQIFWNEPLVPKFLYTQGEAKLGQIIAFSWSPDECFTFIVTEPAKPYLHGIPHCCSVGLTASFYGDTLTKTHSLREHDEVWWCLALILYLGPTSRILALAECSPDVGSVVDRSNILPLSFLWPLTVRDWNGPSRVRCTSKTTGGFQLRIWSTHRFALMDAVLHHYIRRFYSGTFFYGSRLRDVQLLI
jgi:hypothetical protein